MADVSIALNGSGRIPMQMILWLQFAVTYGFQTWNAMETQR